MRAARGAALAALLALGGCATTNVALLDAEPGGNVGAVAVLNPKTEADWGVLDKANTQAVAGRRVTAKTFDASAYSDLADALPPPPARWTLYFPEASTDLTPESEEEFKKVLAEVARRPGAEVQVTGHTDTVDDNAVNDRLSRARAREIASALQKHGLDPAMTRVVGRGERELLIATPDNTPEPKNRRVEITVR